MPCGRRRAEEKGAHPPPPTVRGHAEAAPTSHTGTVLTVLPQSSQAAKQDQERKDLQVFHMELLDVIPSLGSMMTLTWGRGGRMRLCQPEKPTSQDSLSQRSALLGSLMANTAQYLIFLGSARDLSRANFPTFRCAITTSTKLWSLHLKPNVKAVCAMFKHSWKNHRAWTCKARTLVVFSSPVWKESLERHDSHSPVKEVNNTAA